MNFNNGHDDNKEKRREGKESGRKKASRETKKKKNEEKREMGVVERGRNGGREKFCFWEIMYLYCQPCSFGKDLLFTH